MRFEICLFVGCIVFWLLVVGGWVANIVKILGVDFSEPVTVEVVLRGVGIIFFPLGAVMGFL